MHSQNGITPWSTCFSIAEIAQLVEHNLAPRGIKTSPTLARDCKTERALHNAEIAQLVEHNLAKVGVASSSLVFRSKSKSFEDKIKQNPLKHRFRGFFICCRSVSFRHRGAPTRHSPNLEVSLRISIVKIRDTYSEMRGHFDNLGQFFLTISKLFRLTVAYALIKTVR